MAEQRAITLDFDLNLFPKWREKKKTIGWFYIKGWKTFGKYHRWCIMIKINTQK